MQLKQAVRVNGLFQLCHERKSMCSLQLRLFKSLSVVEVADPIMFLTYAMSSHESCPAVTTRARSATRPRTPAFVDQARSLLENAFLSLSE